MIEWMHTCDQWPADLTDLEIRIQSVFVKRNQLKNKKQQHNKATVEIFPTGSRTGCTIWEYSFY